MSDGNGALAKGGAYDGDIWDLGILRFLFGVGDRLDEILMNLFFFFF